MTIQLLDKNGNAIDSMPCKNAKDAERFMKEYQTTVERFGYSFFILYK